MIHREREGEGLERLTIGLGGGRVRMATVSVKWSVGEEDAVTSAATWTSGVVVGSRSGGEDGGGAFRRWLRTLTRLE
jgi:hypothetical protein